MEGMKNNKPIYFLVGGIILIFFVTIGVLQFYLKENTTVTVNGTIGDIKESTSIIESIYLDWWNSSLTKISSQGVKDVYEFKNTYESLNIVIKDTDVLRDVILNEIIIDGKPLVDYDFEIIESKDGKIIYKIYLEEFSNNDTNKITKVINIYNRYDNNFYNIEVDSFQIRFNTSMDSNFVYLNFENYISNFYDKEFKVETSYYSENYQNFIYSFGHTNKNVKFPLINELKAPVDKVDKDTFFKENTTFTIYNRFGTPLALIGVLSSGDLKLLKSYSLSNVYDIELKDQVFTFSSNVDNLFKISKNQDGSVDIQNIVDNYKVYFDENLMRTYRVYEEDEKEEENFINFKMYRDLRDGKYIFSPNKEIPIYKFYDFQEDKFLSYDGEINKFISKDSPSEFVLTKDNKLFDIKSRVFIKKGENQKDTFYFGDSNFKNGDIFKFNNMSEALFKKVSYDEMQNEIISGNYIEVLLKNKENDEFLSVNSKTQEAVNSTLYNDSYLDQTFNYSKGISDLNNFIFEIRPYNSELTSFNLYNKVKDTSLNTDYGFLNNKLIFDKNNDNKVRFVLEKNDGRDNEFKIKDDYGSYLSFNDSDDVARVASTGFLQKFFNEENDFDVFEIYMIDFNEYKNLNSGYYISFSSKSKDKDFSDKVSVGEKGTNLKSLDQYVVLKNKEMIFLTGDNFVEDMVVTKDYKNLKGISNSLTSLRDKNYLGYTFRILNGFNNTTNIEFKN